MDLDGWGLDDVFRRFNSRRPFLVVGLPGRGLPQGRGMRIDLVLVSRALVRERLTSVRDRDARKGQKPSDHAPVVVDFADG